MRLRAALSATVTLLPRLLLAALAGVAVYFSYEPHGLWWAGLGGIGMLWLSCVHWRGVPVRAGRAALIGFVHALTQYLLMLPWIGELVGTMPYVALALWLSVYALLLTPGAVLLARWRWGWLGFPFFYLAIELLRSSVPFGGFAWVRLAWGQINGPLANLAAWGGTALVSLAAALVGTGVAALYLAVLRHAWRESWAAAAVVLPVVLGLVAGLSVNDPGRTVGTAKVAAIQGNVPRLGLDFNAQRRAVLANHVQATAKAAKADPDVDLYIWPENSSDVNPFRDAEAMALIQSAVQAAGAPIVVGTLTVDEVGERNTMQVFNADGSVGEHHYKKYLQPFCETMPWRSFFRTITDMVDLAGDFKPGNGPGVVHMGGIAVGLATCYEVAFDAAYRTSVRNGAQILATPTNNATFGFSDMTYQQLAMSRLRAIETDRAVVVAATSGVSAIVHPDGRVSQESGIFEQKYLIEELPLREGIKPAVKYGALLQAVAVLIGLAAVAAAWRSNRLPRTQKNNEENS